MAPAGAARTERLTGVLNGGGLCPKVRDVPRQQGGDVANLLSTKPRWTRLPLDILAAQVEVGVAVFGTTNYVSSSTDI